MSRPEHAVARVLRDGRPVGLSFLVDVRQLITCAHVVNAALRRQPREAAQPSPDDELVVEFAFAVDHGTPIRRWARVVRWGPSDGPGFDAHDIAGLELTEARPQTVPMLRLVDRDPQGVLAVQMWGPSPDRPHGGHVRGELMGGADAARYQVDQEIRGVFEAAPGFSGGPVWSVESGRVLGLLQARGVSHDNTDVYVLTASALEQTWPDVLLRPPECPYRGLSAFTEQDSTLFFGREAFVSTLGGVARTRPILAVFGPSGGGKSSVIEAGLVPALRQEAVLTVIRLRSDARPVTSLALELERASGGGLAGFDTWSKRLRTGGLRESLDLVRRSVGAARAILVLDQFEQVMSPECVPDERDGMLGLLADFAATPPGSPQPLVLLAVREDFLGSLITAHAQFGDYLQQNAVPLRAMTSDEIRQAIVRPAAEAEPDRPIAYASGLVDQIIDDVHGRPGELPLLQFLLTELWTRQRNDTIGLVAYRDVGGVRQALRRYADERLSSLSDHEQEAARRVFTRLVVPKTRNMARRMPMSALAETDQSIARRLANDRLLVIGQDSTGVDYVDIAHEALLRGWDRLQAWLSEDEEYLRWLAAIEDAHATWQEHGRDPSLLLRGPLLTRAEGMLALRPTETKPLHQFVTASRREVEAEQQQRREEAARSQAIALATHAETARDVSASGPSVSLALAVVSLQLRPTWQGALAAHRALERSPRHLVRTVHGDGVRDIAFSVDGALFATASYDGTARIVDLLTGAEVVRINHDDWVRAVTFSPDGTRLATASGDGTTRILDTSTGMELGRTTHDGPVWAIAFSSLGTLLATASDDGTCRILNGVNGIELARVTHGGPVRAVAFSPDGALLATGSDDGIARIIDVESGQERWGVAHRSSVLTVAFEPVSGWCVASGSADGAARVVVVDSGREIHQVIHDDGVRAVAFSSQGDRLATASGDGTARIIDADTGAELVRIVNDEQTWDVAFSPDGTLLATASSDHTARVFDSHSGAELVCATHLDRVAVVAFHPSGAQIGTGSDDGTARVTDIATGAELLRSTHQAPASAVAFSPDGGRLATASDDHCAHIIDTIAGVDLRHIPSGGAVRALAFRPRGIHLAVGGDDGLVQLIDPDTGERAADIQHDGPVWSVAFSPDGTLLATGGDDRTARIVDLRTGRDVARVAHGDWVRALAFNADGTLLATGSHDGAARIIDVGTGRQLARFNRDGPVHAVEFSPGSTNLAIGSDDRTASIVDTTGATDLIRVVHGGPVWDLAFSFDGTRLASGSDDGTARIVNADTGTELVRSMHDGPVRAVDFSPDGSRLATASADRTARVVDAGTGLELIRSTHDGPVRAVVFSPDGSRLATASADGTVRLWAADNDSLIAQALDRLPRNLTEAEWSRYLPNEPYRRLSEGLP